MSFGGRSFLEFFYFVIEVEYLPFSSVILTFFFPKVTAQPIFFSESFISVSLNIDKSERQFYIFPWAHSQNKHRHKHTERFCFNDMLFYKAKKGFIALFCFVFYLVSNFNLF